MIKKRTTGYLLQDAGLLAFLACIVGTALAVGYSDAGLRTESTVMMLGTFLAVLLAGFKLPGIAVVVAAFEILIYTSYKLYYFFAYTEKISPLCYLWLILPILSVAAMQIFIYGNHQTELENDVLKEQVEELVMVNSLTGLYNLRSLYNDLEKQIAYAERNQMDISLMLIKLRFGQELKSVLSRKNYEALLQRMALLVVDAVRVEDRTYSIDNDGGIGVILTCDQESSVYVKNRIRTSIEEKGAFDNIADKTIRVEVKIACLEYDKEKYGTETMQFKQRVENELQYDV